MSVLWIVLGQTQGQCLWLPQQFWGKPLDEAASEKMRQQTAHYTFSHDPKKSEFILSKQSIVMAWDQTTYKNVVVLPHAVAMKCLLLSLRLNVWIPENNIKKA